MDKAASRVYVYFHCISKASDQVWYRVKFDDEEEDEEEEETHIIKLNPVAKLRRFGVGGIRGSSTVVGNDIYYAGGYQSDFIVPGILKHTIHDDESDSDQEEWKAEGSTPPLTRWEPFVAANKNQLYLVGRHTTPDQIDDTPCGLVYDLITKTWTCLQHVHIIKFLSYDISSQASVVLKEDEAAPKEIMFYAPGNGTIEFLNQAEELLDSGVHDQFSLCQPCKFPPPAGLSNDDFQSLKNVPGCVPAVVIDHTFYWFNLDMCLYGYDSKDKIWIKSQCLKEHFPKPYYQRYDYQTPLLLGLPKSKMLVILPTSDDEFTITSLHVVVDKTPTNLCVSVETTWAYRFDDPYVLVLDGKAMVEESLVR